MFDRLCGYSLIAALTLIFSATASADDPTGAHWDAGYDAGYRQGLADAGVVVGNGGSGGGGASGGAEMTAFTGGTSYFGTLPEPMLGIGGGPRFFNNFCGAENQGSVINFEAAFDGTKIFEHLYGSLFPEDIMNRIRSGQEVFVKGYAFNREKIIESEGQLQWHSGRRPGGIGRIVMNTRCPESSEYELEGVSMMRELGVSTGVAIEILN